MKIILITGVSQRQGIGFAVAKHLGLEGHNIIISARNLEQAENLAQELKQDGVNVTSVKIDLLDLDSIRKATKFIEEKFQKIDILINNAALMLNSSAKFIDKDMDELNIEFQTNVTGTWYVTQQFYPLLVASGEGRIVNISSGAGSFADPDFGIVNFPGAGLSQITFDYPLPAYGLTKLALNGLTIKMAKEFKNDNVLVNAVCPGMTATRPGAADFGARPVEECVDGIVWAATLPKDGPSGQFFRDRKVLPW
ncbi:SDR family NAD(P)-dependent oxidoreductase [Chryseobacterium sp. MYb264]|uniref:SDR family NAD(P)-dependent oxidoreductase n=1 Tax=Chryseobacterium sp. MYb264 TaxID=2745153 RepID=UPI002E16148F|nr:SDR family NAD(P)-dependent oxidoreductase [Chryseobacterium sp. MYb264]